MRTRYWSCSDFADWVRGTPKPGAATSNGWDEWKKEAKEKHPFRFWLSEELLDKLQNILLFPRDLYLDVKHYIHTRFIHRTHALTSTLERGRWYDLDTRMFHCLFDELANFVERQLAQRYLMFVEEKRARFPNWRSPWFRSAECGTAYLAEETALKYDDTWVNEADPRFGKPTPQAIAAQEILDIYHWWRHTRPARRDAHDLSGWSALCEEVWSGKLSRNDEEYEGQSREILEVSNRIEGEYEQEDTEMLIRLIKVRHHLWT